MNQDPTRGSRYTYEDAGFNRFFRRTIAGNPGAQNLTTTGAVPKREIAFDLQQVSGQLGDILKLGSIYIDGKKGRIYGVDDNKNEIWRLGNLD